MNSNLGCQVLPTFAELCQAQKNAVLAAELGIDESTASRIRSGESGLKISQIDLLLAANNLELAPRGAFIVPRDEWLALKRLAKRALEYDIAEAERMENEKK